MNIDDIKARFPELVEAHFEPANGMTVHTTTLPVPLSFGYQKQFEQLAFILAPTALDDVCKTIFHGDEWTRSEFVGLAQLYSTADCRAARSALNVIDCGGDSRHLTSIYLVAWGERKVYLAGHPGDSSDLALVVEDWRYVVRIANIDLDCGEPNLTNEMMRAVLRLPTLAGAKIASSCAFYMAPRAMKLFNKQMDQYCHQFGQERIFNRFRTVAVRETDALHCHETRVI